ncbi:MAG: class I SAM-dependent DNA methyltransferase [bacterium]
MKAYEEDLAYIHDVGFSDFARNAAPGLLGILRQNGIKDGLVVDLGCGSGIWAGELLRAGYEVLGIDFSAAMLKIARRRAPAGKFKRASFVSVELPPCHAVTSLGECLNYLFDKRNSRHELARLFRKIYAALAPDGLFIFDLLEPGYVEGPVPQTRFMEGREWVTIVQIEKTNDPMQVRRHITAFRRIGNTYRNSEEIHSLKLYKRSQVGIGLRNAGFKVQYLRGYGSLSFNKAHAGFLARKP